MDQRRKLLADLIKERRSGAAHFTLASGQQSDFYFDMKPAMLDPDGASLLAELIVDEIKELRPIASAAWRWARFRSSRRSRCEASSSGAAVRLLRAQGAEGSRHQEARRRPRHRRQDRRHSRGRDHDRRLGDGRGQGGEGAGANVALVLSILDRGEGAAELYAEAGIPFKSLFRAEEFLRD